MRTLTFTGIFLTAKALLITQNPRVLHVFVEKALAGMVHGLNPEQVDLEAMPINLTTMVAERFGAHYRIEFVEDLNVDTNCDGLKIVVESDMLNISTQVH